MSINKFLYWPLCALLLVAGCSGKGKAPSAANAPAEPHAEPAAEMAEMPVFASTLNDNAVVVYYWSDKDEPKLDDVDPADAAEALKYWTAQEKFRKNAAAYSNLFVEDGTTAKLRYRNEQWQDADGNYIYPGIIHYRPGVPNCGAYFDATEPGANLTGFRTGVLVTDDYLKSYKQLPLSDIYSEWTNKKQLSEAVVRQLEQKYGMKATRSMQLCRIGDRYGYGSVQFEGVWSDAPRDASRPDAKHCLAVDVLVDGQKLFVIERPGYYESADDFGWNVDDCGEYSGCPLAAAFEGNDGLTLCYFHLAPESLTLGLLSPEGDTLNEKFAIMYQQMIDE